MGEGPDIIMIPDPELVLAEDAIPRHIPVYADSVFFGGGYDNVDLMLAARRKAESKLNRHLVDAQRAITVPCRVVCGTTDPQLMIWGRVPSNDDFVKAAATTPLEEWEHKHATGGSVELRALRDNARHRIEDVNRRGWLFGYWHSPLCPEGEWGSNHRCQVIAVVDEETFDAARDLGWPPIALLKNDDG